MIVATELRIETEMCLFALYGFGIATIKFDMFKIFFPCGMVNIFKLCKWSLVAVLPVMYFLCNKSTCYYVANTCKCWQLRCFIQIYKYLMTENQTYALLTVDKGCVYEDKKNYRNKNNLPFSSQVCTLF